MGTKLMFACAESPLRSLFSSCLLSAVGAGVSRMAFVAAVAVDGTEPAGLLFAARVLPLWPPSPWTLALLCVVSITEPRSITVDEGIGAMPLALGVCALLLIVWMLPRDRAHTITSRVVAGWLDGARL